MSENGNGTNRILSLDQVASQRNAKDDHGRLLRGNATVREAHEIAIEEGNKVHEFYLKQIPPFTARMIQDALVSYGLIKLSPDAQLAATPPDTPTSAPADPLAEQPPTEPPTEPPQDENGGLLVP